MGPWAVPVEAGRDWVIAYHGMRLGSTDHGVCFARASLLKATTPSHRLRLQVCQLHHPFRDQVFHRCVRHVLVDPRRIRRYVRARGLWVFPKEALATRGVWVLPNSGAVYQPSNERFSDWEAQMEAVRPGWPPPVVSPGPFAIQGWPEEPLVLGPFMTRAFNLDNPPICRGTEASPPRAAARWKRRPVPTTSRVAVSSGPSEYARVPGSEKRECMCENNCPSRVGSSWFGFVSRDL